jgi:magnesium-transporting ATPase (P-type)
MKPEETTHPPPAWHAMTPREVLEAVSSAEQGLTRAEAARRLAAGMGNSLPAPTRPSWLNRVWGHLKGPVSLLLAGVGLLALGVGAWLDGAVLLGVVALNALIGVLHERKADRSMERIRNLCVSRCRVVRDGRREELESHHLVVGDLVDLEAGQRVPADMRVLQAEHLHLDESLLTGESVPALKSPAEVSPERALAEQSSMVFAGTSVCSGRGRAVVVGTGVHTFIGALGVTLEQIDERMTPLLRQLDRLAKWLTGAILGAACGTFFYGLWVGAMSSSELFLASVAFAAAAIPEGLSAALTIALGIGVGRMAEHQAIVRRLPVVEALGAVTVICSDKTGTLTTNQMTVEQIVTARGTFHSSGTGWSVSGSWQGSDDPEARASLLACCRAGMLCNDADLHCDEDGTWRPSGDPTEAALLVAARKAGLCDDERKASPRVLALPFSHARPMMASLHAQPDGSWIVWVKGSPEEVLARSHMSCATQAQTWHDQQRQLAEAGLRLLAVASKRLESAPTSPEQLEQACHELDLLGLVAMADPPHPCVQQAIARCQLAGIQLKMITGDHLETARAISQRIGLTDAHSYDAVMTGSEWKRTPRERWREIVQRTRIFARTEPAQKLEIVQALQEAGEVVAMTGDGVNDAPALKRAEVGIACGADAADAAKEASSIVLTQGRFDAIARAVAEGRTIYENIQKVVMFLLSSGASEAVLAAAAIFVGGQLPILPIQILWTNLITTVILGLALAIGSSHPLVMQRPPRRPHDPLIPHDLKLRLAWGALIGAAFPLLFFDWALDHGRSLDEARTLCMTVLLMGEIALMMSLRHLRETRWDRLADRPADRSWIGALLVFGLQLALMYVPVLQTLFHTAPLPLSDWFAIAACWSCQIVSFEWLKGWSHLFQPGSTQQPSPAACCNDDQELQVLPKAASDDVGP